jgi:hypothetical protein
MNKFTKTYNVEINEKQKATLIGQFKMVASYIINQEKKDVQVIVDKFEGKQIIAKMIVDNRCIEAVIIGPMGGTTIL